MRKTTFNHFVSGALGIASMSALSSTSIASSWYDVPIPQSATPYIDQYNWQGVFRLLDSEGQALSNTSAHKGANSYETPISGTMLFDDNFGTANTTMAPFDFFQGDSQFEMVSFNLWSIGDGAGGPGTLMIGNMLFNWDNVNGIPASIVLDASGLFAGELTAGGSNSATPASDGAYTNSVFGYLNTGPVPIATTAYNTTVANAFGNGDPYSSCQPGVDNNYLNNVGGGCMGNDFSGTLPLIYDNANSGWYDTANTGGTIGGSPMLDGPFQGYSINIEFVNLTLAPPAVPIPAAVWLFGSGLIALIGVARRNKVKNGIGDN